MAKKASPHRRLIITKNLILMLVMLAIIALSSVAWFTIHAHVTADGISVRASKSADIQLALPRVDSTTGEFQFPLDDDFDDSIDFKDSNFIDKLIKDITSDGTTFVNPSFESETSRKDGRTVITDGTWIEGLSSKAALTDDKDYNDELYNYVSLDFYIRSGSKSINLNRASFLAAQSELEDKSMIGNNLTHPTSINASQPFSADAIVGAMRLSLHVGRVTALNGSTDTVTPQTCQLVWLPRPDLHLNTDEYESNWTLNTGVRPDNTTLAKETYRHTYYEGQVLENTSVKKGVVKKTMYDGDTLDELLDAVPVPATAEALEDAYTSDNAVNNAIFKVSRIPDTDYTKLDAKSANTGSFNYHPCLNQEAPITDSTLSSSDAKIHFQSGDYYVYKVTLNLWIEGVDAEARRAMNDGQFKMDLVFDAH